MNKKYNKNKFPLAKRALLHFYHCKYLGNEEFSDILNECRTLEDVCELEMQMMCEENNDVLVSAVLLDASDEEREFYNRCDESRLTIIFYFDILILIT